MANLLKSPWAEIREVVEVLVVGSIITGLGNVSQMIKLNLIRQRSDSFLSDPTQPGLLEISVDTLFRFQAFLSSGCVLVLFVGVFTNLFAIYYSAKNDDLLLSIRLILTGENVQRFVYTVLKMANYMCTALLNTVCAKDGIAGFIFQSFGSLFIVNAFCQTFVSFSRFMAVSFKGMLFKYTTKLTLLQFIVCYSIATSLCCVILFANSEIVNVYVTPTLAYFTITMDFFTFLKLRKLNKSKVSMAERRLMVQMICNSTYYFTNYFLSSLITIVQYPFFGYFLSNVALQVNTSVLTCIYTFGLSYINMVYLKKKVPSWDEKGKYNSTSSRAVKPTTVTRTSSNCTPKI